ncbi:hypothetical protein C8Q74DRAFT_1427955 [Fomes fomentarius]|nr:hypothetical protein C8Q74DRAFT_1427955 [Fomes fomentarius]
MGTLESLHEPWGLIDVLVDLDSSWMCSDGTPPQDAYDGPSGFRCLRYEVEQWRERRWRLFPRDLASQYKTEASLLSILVPSMHDTAEVIEIPVETAPLARMATLSWRRVQQLSLYGKYVEVSQSTWLPLIISGMYELCRLSIMVAQPFDAPRPPILGKSLSGHCDCPFPSLRSLTLAYPDPEDAIFAARFPSMTHLSLCDHPRFYHDWYECIGYNEWASPILSASESLSILSRMELPLLTSLELVYMADEADSKLIRHITSTYPSLVTLELHRYRRQPEDLVQIPYLQIARELAKLISLRTLRLNLDFPDTCGVAFQRSEPELAEQWDAWHSILEARGQEILDIMETGCPQLQHVALIHHGERSSAWVEWRPDRVPYECIEDRPSTKDGPALPSPRSH